MIPQTLTIKDIAALLHLSPRSVQNMIYRNDPRIPPRLNIPGGKPLWHPEDVQKWLDERRAA